MTERYVIRVEGHLDPRWSDWLEGLQLAPLEDGQTMLSGQITDQAALHGLLNRLWDMNLKLLYLERKEGN